MCDVPPGVEGKSWGNEAILVEVVVLSSQGLDEDKEDAAAKGAGVRRGAGKLSRPLASGLIHAQGGWVGEDTSRVEGYRAGVGCENVHQAGGGLTNVVGGAEAGVVPVPPDGVK